MLTFLVRIIPLGFAAFVLLISCAWWHFGEPPTWTVFSPRQTVTVISTTIETEPVGNGTTRYIPVVEVVAGDQAADAPVRLLGLRPGFSSGSAREAEQILSRYQGRTQISARMVGGRLYADRYPLFLLLGAVASGLLGLVALAAAIRMNLGWFRRKR